MKVKVTKGSIKNNDIVYTEGQVVELADNEAEDVIRVGVAEEYKPEPKEEPKEEVKKEEVKEEVEEPKEEEPAEVQVELSELTRKELNDYALEQGLEAPEKFVTKGELIKALEGGENE